MYLPKDDMKSVVIPTNIGILYPILKKNVISFKNSHFAPLQLVVWASIEITATLLLFGEKLTRGNLKEHFHIYIQNRRYGG